MYYVWTKIYLFKFQEILLSYSSEFSDDININNILNNLGIQVYH